MRPTALINRQCRLGCHTGPVGRLQSSGRVLPLTRPPFHNNAASLVARRPAIVDPARSQLLHRTARFHSSAHRLTQGQMYVRFVRPTKFQTIAKVIGSLYILSLAATSLSKMFGVDIELDDGTDDEHSAGQKKRSRDTRLDQPNLSTDSFDEDGMEQEGDFDMEDSGELLSFIVWSLPQELPRELYHSADPEWQQYTKISSNPKLVLYLKQKLAAFVRKSVSMPAIGKITPSRGRFWLEFVFPYGPPPLYEVSGIGIYQNQITIGSSTITQQEYARLKHMFTPTGIVVGSYALFKTVTRMQYNRLKSVLQGKGPEKGGFKTVAFPEQPVSTTTSATTVAESSVPSQVDDLTKINATKVFLQAITKSKLGHRPKEPPQGCCFVTGKVELIGTDGWSLLDVVGIFDPSKNAFMSVDVQVNMIQPYTMKAKGTPKGVPSQEKS